MGSDGKEPPLIPEFARPKFPTKAKVRPGRKNAKGWPEAVEWFLCEDDPTFAQLVGAQPNPLRIVFPYDRPEDCFTANLEYWANKIQACYSQDGRVAHRLAGADGWTFDHRARARTEVVCRGVSCPDQGGDKPKCKATGRLYFFLEAGGDRNGVYQLDTHGRETIQRFAAVLSVWQHGGLLNRGATLGVAMKNTSKGRYPVMTLEVDGVPHVQEELNRMTGQNVPVPTPRDELIALLRTQGQDPRDPKIVAWVQQVGVDQALAKLKARAEGRA